MKKNQSLLGKLALLVTAILWGTSFVVLKNTLDSIGTLWVLALRFTFSALIMLCVTFRSVRHASARCLKGGAWMGAALAAAYIVQTYGLVYTTPGKNAFLTSTYCVLTPFFSWAVYRRRPELSHLIAALFCVAGIGFISLSEGFTDVNVGDLLTLFCGVFYSIHILLIERFSDSGDAATLSTLQFAVAACICWIGALLGVVLLIIASAYLFHGIGERAPQPEANTPAQQIPGTEEIVTDADTDSLPRAETGTGVTMTLAPKPEGDALSLQEIYRECLPSVVAIRTTKSKLSGSLGTGIVMTADGYLITNAHVLDGAKSVTVTLLADETEHEAKLVGTDSVSDLAVLKIEAQNLKPAEFGQSDSLQVGDDVIAIGNPLGTELNGTMTNGIVSAINRNVIFGGHSMTLGVEGICFAIPTSVIRPVVDALIADGQVNGRASIGIVIGALDASAAEYYDLPQGLYVESVAEGSDAAKQGIQPGDIVTAVNGQDVTTTYEVNAIKEAFSVGDTMTLTIYRDGETFDVTVTLMDTNDVY